MNTPENCQCYSFILFGNTGVGKSTFLNVITGSNQFKTSSSPKSCTKGVIAHQFLVDNVKLMAIDTSGFNDSNGIEEEQENFKQLINFLRKNENGLNGIGIVISSSDCRLNIFTKKTIKLIHQVIGNDDFWSHLCFIVTHCPCHQEDIEELKDSMTSKNDSLRAGILKLIRNISSINEDPPIPFFFVDSLHPNHSPSRETIPQFKNWLFGLQSFKTTNLKEPDVKYQYKEERNLTEKSSGEMLPIFDYIRQETQKIIIKESVPIVVKKTGHRNAKKELEYPIIFDPGFNIGPIKVGYIPIWIEYQEPYEYEEIQYQEREKVIEKPGDLQKVIKGYYQETKLVTKSWIAYWDYELDIINKNKPSLEGNYKYTNETKIDYYDDQQKKLSTEYDLEKISKLKELISF